MELTPEMVSLGSELALIAGKSAEAIFDRIRAAKEKGDDKQTIVKLEGLINELIQDKNMLTTIAQAYKEKLMAQTITDNEIEYISEQLLPLIEEMVSQSNSGDAVKIRAGIKVLKPVLSKETFTIMQILGFNFKEAIGEPLTKLVAGLISEKIPNEHAVENSMIQAEREIEYLKICQDEGAFERLQKIRGL